MMIQRQTKSFWFVRKILSPIIVIVGAAGLTLIFFLVLPLMQTLAKPPKTDMIVQNVNTGKLDTPPPPPEESEPEEPEPEEQPPQLAENAQPLSLEQLSLALNPGFSDSWVQGDFAIKINSAVSTTKDVDEMFSLAELDQRPRIVYQPAPMQNKDTRKMAPGTVYIIFVVDQQGQVQNAKIQKSSDPVFEGPALRAIKQWKFEPGKRNGKPVRFRMRVPITFPKG